MTTLVEAWELSRADSGLAIVSTLRADQSIQASLVNTGIVDGKLAFVTYGKVKLANLRQRPQVTVAFRNGWQWAAAEGTARMPMRELISRLTLPIRWMPCGVASAFPRRRLSRNSSLSMAKTSR